MRVARHEGDRPEREGARQKARALPPSRIDDREDREEPVADRRTAHADPRDRPLAVEVVGVHARPGGPPLALDLEERLVGVVGEQLELLEPHGQAQLPKGVGDRIGGPRRRVAAGRARADAARQSLDEIHAGHPS